MKAGMCACVLCAVAIGVQCAFGGGGKNMPGSKKPAIVLAAFGTTEPKAVDAVMNVKRRVEASFPEYDVYLGFTSNIIRKRWHERAVDAAFRAAHPGIPEELYGITNVFSALAAAQEEGFRPILVQSLHVTDGEEFHDLKNLVETLARYETAKAARKPFPAIGVGVPALGTGDGREKYLDRAAEAFSGLANRAQSEGAALVLMAHGNELLNQTVFKTFERVLRERYNPEIYIGTVEAPPLAEDVVGAVKASVNAPEKILLAPLMVVAGDHALNDMAGDADDSWASLFARAGFTVECHMEGLGANVSWADIYVEHLKELEKNLGMAK